MRSLFNTRRFAVLLSLTTTWMLCATCGLASGDEPAKMVLAQSVQSDTNGSHGSHGFGHAAEERVIMTLMLGLIALAMVVFHWRDLKDQPGIKWWVAALLMRLVAWSIATVEITAWSTELNFAEHSFLLMSTTLVVIGAWHACSRPRQVAV